MTSQSGGIGSSGSPYLYLPSGWNTGWIAAKAAAAAGTSPAHIQFFGDSIVSGTAGVSDWKKTYPHLVRESLKGGLGGLKSDYWPAYGLSLVTGAAVVGTPPWDVGSFTTSSGRQGGLSWHSMVYETAAGAQAGYERTFTSYDTCTALDIFYLDYNSGTWVYSIDGGADQTVTCTNATTPALAPTKKISITGLANTTHTVRLGKQSAASVCLPVGIATHNSALTGGLQISRFCNANAVMSTDYVSTVQIPNTSPTGRLELLAGLTPSGGGGTGTAFGYPMQPHLSIFSLGVNDCGNSASQTDFQTAMRRYIQALRKGQQNASIIIHIVCNPDANISDNTSNSFQAANWAGWMQLMSQFAQLYNCAILNTHARWGEYPVTNGMQSIAANVHPLDAGQQDIANVLMSIL